MKERERPTDRTRQRERENYSDCGSIIPWTEKRIKGKNGREKQAKYELEFLPLIFD